MAWVAPKTNWAAADGVRNTDFNRIEGNILELYNTGQLRADTVRYVSASTGNDNNAGTAPAPFATINKALSSIPKNLAGKTAMISIDAGTYNEAVTIKGFDGQIELSGSSGDVVTVNSFRVDNDLCALNNITVATSSTVFIMSGARLIGDGKLQVTGAATGLNVGYGSQVSIDVFIGNSITGYMVSVSRNSSVRIRSIEGTLNRNGINCDGSVVRYADFPATLNGTRLFSVAGGRIYTGAQLGTS